MQLVAHYSLLHVNVAGRLLEAVVGDNISFHGVVSVAIFGVDKLAKVVLARPVYLVLVVLLNVVGGVAEDFAIFDLLCLLGLREARIQHVLIVLDNGCVAAELVVESILRVRKNVSLVA